MAKPNILDEIVADIRRDYDPTARAEDAAKRARAQQRRDVEARADEYKLQAEAAMDVQAERQRDYLNANMHLMTDQELRDHARAQGWGYEPI